MALIRKFDGEEGVIDFPLFSEEIVVFVSEAAPLEYAERCAAYLANLPDSVIDKLCEGSIRYCESMRQHFGQMGISIPENIPLRDILKYIQPGSLIVEEPEDDTVAFHLSMNCDWEEEHGMEWCIRDGQVLYVGSFDDVSPWESKEYFKNDSWNYAVID